MLKENEVKRIILGTGSYDTVKFGNTVSITGDGGNAWNYFGPAYKKLAPRLMTYLLYADALKDLEMEDFLKTLEAKFGTNIIFLCHEPVNEFCHRRVLADYIELQTGVYIPEVKIMSNDEFTLKQPLNYKQELKRIMKL